MRSAPGRHRQVRLGADSRQRESNGRKFAGEAADTVRDIFRLVIPVMGGEASLPFTSAIVVDPYSLIYGLIWRCMAGRRQACW